jgi:hypothetical protein
MKAFKLLLLAAALVASNSASIRGSLVHLRPEEQTDNRRRHLLQESTCTLYQKCTTYEPTDEHPNGYHEETWACELSAEDSARLDVDIVDVAESSVISSAVVNAISGESTLTMSRAVLDTDTTTMYVPKDARVQVRSAASFYGSNNRMSVRSKPSNTGILRALMIRVTDKNNLGPENDASELSSMLFDENEVSLTTQMAACSHEKSKIEPFEGKTPGGTTIENGVIDIKVTSMAANEKKFAQEARLVAKDLIGDLNDPMFDLVMYCLPKGQPGLAWAYPNNKYSFYSNKFCGAVGVNMHEIGHNLGLAHSGQIDEGEYGDRIGVMGSNPGRYPVEMCYNPQKSFQLEWYKDQTATIDPLDGSGNRRFLLNAVSDYKKNEDAIIVLRLEQISIEGDYYVGFNRAEGITADTGEDHDMVSIAIKEKGGANEYGKSTKLASLEPGQSFVIEDFDDVRDVTVYFVDRSDGDATILVCDGSPCDITSPVMTPSEVPNIAPYPSPVSLPTLVPTKKYRPPEPGVCRNRAKKRFAVRRTKPIKKKTCKQLARNGKCDWKLLSGRRYVWQICEKSCNRCPPEIAL